MDTTDVDTGARAMNDREMRMMTADVNKKLSELAETYLDLLPHRDKGSVTIPVAWIRAALAAAYREGFNA